MKKISFGNPMQDAANKAIQENGIRVRTAVKPLYEEPKVQETFGGLFDNLVFHRHPMKEKRLSESDLDRLVVREMMRLVQRGNARPMLEVYYGPEVDKQVQKVFEHEKPKVAASITVPSKTGSREITFDPSKGEVGMVQLFNLDGKLVATDYFYKNMVRSQAEYEWARGISLRKALAQESYEKTKINRTLKEIKGERTNVEKAIRQMRFLERFLCGETRQEIGKIEGITHQRVMDVMEDGIRRLVRQYRDEISFIEPYGEQHWDMADYGYHSAAFMWPSGGKQILENKDVLLVFARRFYEEVLRPKQHQLQKEEEALHV